MNIKPLFSARGLFYGEGELLDQVNLSGEAGFEHKSVCLHVLDPKLLYMLYCSLLLIDLSLPSQLWVPMSPQGKDLSEQGTPIFFLNYINLE